MEKEILMGGESNSREEEKQISVLLRTRGETETYRVGKRGREGRGGPSEREAVTGKKREVKRTEEEGRKEV